MHKSVEPEEPGPGKISGRLSRKGPLIEETYRTFQHWDSAESPRENLARIFETNAIGASSRRWLKEILATISSRFSSGPPLAPLVALAKAEVPMEIWRPCLLWHSARGDLLYYRFATEWLYNAFLSRTPLLRTEDLVPFVDAVTKGQMKRTGELSEYGKIRTARDLLMAASHFGLIEGRNTRRFAHYTIPEPAFLYIAHAVAETESNARRLLDSPDWRLFLLSSMAVERQLHELHQFRKLSLEIAGSIAQLRLPCRSLLEYAERIGKERSSHV